MEMSKPSKKEQEAIDRASVEHLKRTNIDLPEGKEENDDIPIDVELSPDLLKDIVADEQLKREKRDITESKEVIDDIPIDIDLPPDISRDAASEEYLKRMNNYTESEIEAKRKEIEKEIEGADKKSEENLKKAA